MSALPGRADIRSLLARPRQSAGGSLFLGARTSRPLFLAFVARRLLAEFAEGFAEVAEFWGFA